MTGETALRWSQDDPWSFVEMLACRSAARFIRGTDFAPAIRRWTPDLLDEIQGIATGAAMDRETILAFQLLDEMWSSEDIILGDHCSSLGFPAQGAEPAHVAQNVDVELFRDGFQVLLHIKHADSDLESFVLSTAGLSGFNLNRTTVGKEGKNGRTHRNRAAPAAEV